MKGEIPRIRALIKAVKATRRVVVAGELACGWSCSFNPSIASACMASVWAGLEEARAAEVEAQKALIEHALDLPWGACGAMFVADRVVVWPWDRVREVQVNRRPLLRVFYHRHSQRPARLELINEVDAIREAYDRKALSRAHAVAYLWEREALIEDMVREGLLCPRGWIWRGGYQGGYYRRSGDTTGLVIGARGARGAARAARSELAQFQFDKALCGARHA